VSVRWAALGLLLAGCSAEDQRATTEPPSQDECDAVMAAGESASDDLVVVADTLAAIIDREYRIDDTLYGRTMALGREVQGMRAPAVECLRTHDPDALAEFLTGMDEVDLGLTELERVCRLIGPDDMEC